MEITKEYDIDIKYVPLEVTESATIDNAQVLEIMKLFHDAGFPLYLDDFGAGYSSLATLNLMIFDTLKLDKSLVDFIGNDNGEKLLSYTIQLAKSLGMKITAEGVELEEQVKFLQNLKCDEIQGYFFSKPLPLADFEKLL
jgi:EAL domain-containing protein (putative c-di-GMP-specific phosphodiesterase class I)